ncbi:PLDc N-terminal domain-containing protein [Aquipuribacter sp. SD81]|uniref:PLDc N-terminal domain-containing protein n=1 Tax=Aquipuribacter sp. SD81 TaxID=3127703 RepID=UPI003015F340
MRALIIPGLLLAFTIYCLIDVIRSEDSDVRGLPKLVWVLLVLLFPLAGGVAWFVAGRPRASRLPGTERLGRPRPRVLGPDDDPDFLRGLDRRPPDASDDEGDDTRPPGASRS